MEGNTMLEIKNLTKIYKGGKEAVSNLSLTVNAGDICVFIGRKNFYHQMCGGHPRF